MPYSIVNADLKEDQDLIVSLWKRNFEGSPNGRFEWIYKNNPYGQPITFLLREENDGSIIGSYSLFPRTIWINGEYYTGYICGDLVVDTQHRTLGPAMTLIKAALKKSEEEDLVLFGFPNNLSGPVLLLCGFKEIGPRTQLTKVIKSEYLISRHIKQKYVSKILSYPVDMYLSFKYCDMFNNKKNKYKFEVLDSFDSRFDELNDNVLPQCSLKGVVSSQYLSWRFENSPYGKSLIFVMTEKESNKIIGFIVFCENKKKISILDLAIKNNSMEEFRLMISRFSKELKSKKYESISYQYAGDNNFLNILKKNGFSIRSQELKTILYLPNSKKDKIDEIKKGHWYLTAADNDL
ncbi:GNAT family N-acetyltransferase [Desulfuromonas sp. KJ2020]|uniref:GNAT family N-acetyltransferase n=1 Tax=Desulfuromonas sp. KJ2020 TaxID=2919173 RepID=UPI0020A808D2|nr:GNAT family N-acetyltransferase [Desulfuromonas sp. KJ2020]MCP3178148.1 GNAT family N-acetyltransferase [Desulfuromonas sp. KJ2020]